MSADTITPAVAVGAVLRARSRRTALVFVLAAALLAAVAVASILVGVRGIDPAAVWQAFTHPVADDVDHMVVLLDRGGRLDVTATAPAASAPKPSNP